MSGTEVEVSLVTWSNNVKDTGVEWEGVDLRRVYLNDSD